MSFFLHEYLSLFYVAKILHFQDRNFPNTLIEMKRLAEESQRFRVEDVPPRLHEKERVAHSFREIEKQLRDSGEQLGMFSNKMSK